MPAPTHLDPRLLRAFVAVAEELHFTRAAAPPLRRPQQALSGDVRRLERELGAELFVETTRQVTPTADGERLLPYARRGPPGAGRPAGRLRAGPTAAGSTSTPQVWSPAAWSWSRPDALAPEQELMARYEAD